MFHRSHELRKGRVSLRDQTYHVTFTTHDRTPLFENFMNARTVVNALRASDIHGFSKTIAFVVMPDHVHWLLELKNDTLGRTVARVKSQVTRTLAKSATVWQREFYDHALRRDETAETVSAYIVSNPVHGGLAKEIEQYSHWYLAWMDAP
jgi:putative transposase